MKAITFRKLILSLLLLFIAQRSFTQRQDANTDDLIASLERETVDSIKVDIYAQLAGQLFQSAPDSALAYAEAGLEIAQNINYRKGLGDIYINMGNVFYIKGDPPQQLDYYLKSLKIREEIGDKAGIAHCHNNMGNFYLEQYNLEKARENFEKALEIREALGEKNAIAGTLNNLGNVLLQEEEFEKALEKYNKALLINEETGNKYSAAITLGNIGLIYSRLDQLNKAEEYYRRGLEIRKELGQKNGIALMNNRLGGVYYKQGDYSRAILHFRVAMETATEIGGKNYLETAYQGLAEAYEARGDYRQALNYIKDYSNVKDSLYSLESANAIAEMEAKYLAEKRNVEQEKELRERELRELEQSSALSRQRILTIALIIGFVLILIIAFVLFNQTRLKQKANEILEEEVDRRTQELTQTNIQLEREVNERKKTEQDLIQTNKELNTFMYKSSHDIKSPLTSIKGLVGIAAGEVAEGSQQKQYFELINERIEHLDGILERLIQNVRMKEGTIQSEMIDLDEVMVNVTKLVGAVEGFEEVEIKVENELGRKFRTDPAIIETILQNLVSNSIIFRKKEISDSWCRVNFRMEGENNLSVTVSDNGIGISEKVKPKIFDMFYRGSLASRGTGLGLYIVRNLVKKAGGSVSIQSEDGKGTTATVLLPESPEPDPKEV